MEKAEKCSGFENALLLYCECTLKMTKATKKQAYQKGHSFDGDELNCVEDICHNVVDDSFVSALEPDSYAPWPVVVDGLEILLHYYYEHFQDDLVKDVHSDWGVEGREQWTGQESDFLLLLHDDPSLNFCDEKYGPQ
jgi:hypothetical protein